MSAANEFQIEILYL